MEMTIQFGGAPFEVTAQGIRQTGDRVRMSGSGVEIRLPRSPVRYFRHGWQSWSLAAWTEIAPLAVQRPRILHPMETDPRYVGETLPHGSWLGAVAFEDGNVLLLGALGLETHVRLRGDHLEGWCETGRVEWLLAWGEEAAVFSDYAGLLGESFGMIQKRPAPRIWCSWYSLYQAIDESLLQRVFERLAGLPFDVFQVDDGWQAAVGDWEANHKFPGGMQALAASIRQTQRRAGLWLAPLIAVRSSRLFREHPDWFLKDERGRPTSAGFNWGEPLHALDATHPAVLDWLARLMKQVRSWGFDYFKLDFLYGGALPGRRFNDAPRETCYRQALRIMRDAMGPDAYLLACGAPLLPSLGLCDALRVGPDVSGEWENHRDAVLLSNPTTPAAKNAVRTTLHELWLERLVQIDPDVVYFTSHRNSLTTEQKQALQDLALVCGFKATSDLPQWLSGQERDALRLFLTDLRRPVRTGRYTFSFDGRTIDFSAALSLPPPAKGLDLVRSLLIGWLGEQPWALRMFDRLARNSLEKMKKELQEEYP
ncbi:MAG: glycoside hydrolase family 36 protein [Bacteroidota bacterium]